MTATLRWRAQIRLAAWRRGMLDTEDARRKIVEFVTNPDNAGDAVDLVVARIPAWPDVERFRTWPDEASAYGAVPGEWVDLVRFAGQINVIGAPDVKDGWKRLLLAAAMEAAEAAA